MTVSQIGVKRLKNILSNCGEERLPSISVAENEIKKVMIDYFELDKSDIEFDVKKLGDKFSIKIIAQAQGVKKVGILPH
ncbi:MAG: hypothetical protein RR458_06805 [Clostridia bacterium]